MAMDPEEIAEALALDYERDKTVVDTIKGRIDARLDSLNLTPFQRLQAESLVKGELGAWQEDFMYGAAPLPRTTEAWRDGVDACMAKAERSLEASLKLKAEMEASTVEAYDAREEQYQKEAARMDQDAAIKLEEFSEDAAPRLLRHADMDEVVAARLGKNDAVGTSALASCTGVSLYDPKTGVGAVMHVYQGKITIEDALKAMRAQDSSIKASDLQVTLMPGTAKGVNMSHLASLHDQLETAGITQVRDFSKEGRTSSTLMLRGDGMVISTSEADKLAMAPSVGLPGARSRSDSVGSLGPPPPQVRPEDLPPLPDTPEPEDLEVAAIMGRSRSFSDVSPPPRPPSNLPPLPDTPEPEDLEVASIMARSRSFSDLSPPPRPPSHLPPLPDTPEPEDLEVASIMARSRSFSDLSPPPRPPSNLPPLPDTPEPDSPDVSNAPEGRARSPSVREALAMGRSRQNSPSEGLAQDGVSTGSKVKR